MTSDSLYDIIILEAILIKGGNNMSELAQIISTVGFPIVSFLIAAYFIKYTYDKTAESNKDAMSKK